jgi:hypothetical protein
MLPEYRQFSEYLTEDETILFDYLLEDYQDIVTEQQAKFLWSEAYDRRHSGGLEEVYCEFVSLVRMFHVVRSM